MFFGRPAPAYWHGYVAETPNYLAGIGGVYLAEDGRMIMAFDKVRGVRAKLMMHRAAKRVMADVVEAGTKTIYAVQDTRITGADLWLKRLGFTLTDQEEAGFPLWIWQQQQS